MTSFMDEKSTKINNFAQSSQKKIKNSKKANIFLSKPLCQNSAYVFSAKTNWFRKEEEKIQNSIIKCSTNINSDRFMNIIKLKTLCITL